MEGISKKRLQEILETNELVTDNVIKTSFEVLLEDLIEQCQELQEPWMTLDEFLKSGFIGLCWIEFPSEIVTDAYYDGHLFKHSSTSDFAHDENYITNVMPIHKPEPPR